MISATRYRAAAEINRQGKLAQEIARAQADISTQKRIVKPSDDPAAAARASQIRRSQADQAVWKANIDAATNVANQVDTTLTSVAISIDRARELMLSARSSTLSADDRSAIALELRGIAENIENFSNDFDSVGNPLFPEGEPLQVSIAGAIRVSATVSRGDAFNEIATANGPQALADIMRNAADAVEIADETSRANATGVSLDEVDDARVHFQAVRASQGVRGARLEAAAEALETTNLLLEEERTALEATDIASTVTRLNAKLLSLEAAQSAFARVNRQTLFDILG